VSHRRFILPRRDQSWLTEPSAAQWPELLSTNSTALSQWDYDCQGRSLTSLRTLTQQHVRQAAAEYTSQLLGTTVTAPTASRWIVTGHQPELFHVGVWMKNFAAHQWAKSTHSVGLNLIVDQDTHTGLGISVPTGTRLEPSTTVIPFDQPRPVSPWEELSLNQRELFDTFAARVRHAMQPWRISPVLTDAWPAAKAYADRMGGGVRLADCLAAARVTMEHRWGAGNLELPMSRVADLPGFHWFTAHLLAQLPRFHAIHNEAVQSYRRRHGLRSGTHPVPDLAETDGWREAPFWVWRRGATRRDRLFAKQIGPELHLRDQQGVFLMLPLTPDRSACCAVEQLAMLPRQGIKLRSRALTTTLFARIYLADLFLHGIGGAKYDEITDELMTRFFGVTAPQYATISATLHLPLGGLWPVGTDDVAQLSQTLWQLAHQPEQFVTQPAGESQALITEKLHLLAEQRLRDSATKKDRSRPTRAVNRQRYLRLRELTRRLQPDVESIRAATQTRRQEVQSLLDANRVLGSREFSWVLFPEEKLRDFIATMPRGMIDT